MLITYQRMKIISLYFLTAKRLFAKFSGHRLQFTSYVKLTAVHWRYLSIFSASTRKFSFFIFNKNQSPQKPSTCINLIQQWCHYDVIFVLIYTVFIKKHPPFYITSRTSSSLLRHRATLRAIEHLAESFKVTQGHSKWQCSAGRV